MPVVMVLPRSVKNASESKIASTTLRCLATALLFVYIGWNAFWLSQQVIPPSLFTALTGLPCPTTGATRACRCLIKGDVRESLRFNAMAIPLVAMFLATAVTVVYRVRRRRTVSLPGWFVPAWLGLLSLAWILKLSSSPSYW